MKTYVVSVKWMEIDTLDIVYVYNVSVYKPGLHTNFFVLVARSGH